MSQLEKVGGDLESVFFWNHMGCVVHLIIQLFTCFFLRLVILNI